MINTGEQRITELENPWMSCLHTWIKKELSTFFIICRAVMKTKCGRTHYTILSDIYLSSIKIL